MTTISYNNAVINTSDGESILEALLRHDYAIPNGCRSGVCQSCLMQSEQTIPCANAQQGLSDAQKQLGYFLSCQCVPSEEMQLKSIDSEALRVTATVTEKTLLNPSVVRLRLSADLSYLAGQYVTLWREDGLGRSYSLASYPGQDDTLEFHIAVLDDGAFSPWVKEELAVGDALQIQGPVGKCIYTADPEQPVLLAGIGTGLAPLYGILKQALAEGHQGPIHLVIGARETAQFYLVESLQQLADQYGPLSVHFIAQDGDGETDIYRFCQSQFADLKDWRVFLCGADSFVRKMRKQCFLSGAGMQAISSDSFLACSN